ncbi:PE family protein [Mycobacteroides abscessus subsp. abscessus]|uniref:PE family protein n=1 Tax=Mycobacteroides abscessus TaxID=36809 RepID=UPI000926462F|nr:PE family protein [Mycobacteroides abscessus subsp. abscessus]SIC92896.1 PE family protein [Mycobacteroides abscessus subsp. abscessus]SID12536.1 PE family protein [Mycobacteroides abscessus subsp. abscessus]SID16586.1 PE family protein [Mycobacteroides abscessus subsp. abscessus]SKT51398.1 PE family protein [Mycobacteroides abscessus subsp. abscessus]
MGTVKSEFGTHLLTPPGGNIMQLDVVPEALQAASAQTDALAARVTAGDAAHLAICGAITPAGADLVSLKTKLGLTAEAVAHDVPAVQGAEEVFRSAVGLSESAASYTTGDMLAAAAVLPIAL